MMEISGKATLGTSPAQRPVDPALKKAAQAFEAVFVRQMMGAMRSASLSDGLLDTSATEQFRDMSDARTAETLAARGAVGIADILMRQLSPLVSPSPTQTADAEEKSA